MSDQAERRVREEFDTWAAEGRGERMAVGHRAAVEQALERVPIGSGDNALDLGCGVGWACHLMRERGAGRVVGVEASRGMLARARPAPGVALVGASMTALPFRDATFSRALSVESLYYVPDVNLALREVRRVLAPEGRFIVMMDLYGGSPVASQWIDALKVKVHLLHPPLWRRRLERAGFSRVEIFHVRDPRPPLSESEFTPSPWFLTHADYLAFREAGSLILDAQ